MLLDMLKHLPMAKTFKENDMKITIIDWKNKIIKVEDNVERVRYTEKTLFYTKATNNVIYEKEVLLINVLKVEL